MPGNDDFPFSITLNDIVDSRRRKEARHLTCRFFPDKQAATRTSGFFNRPTQHQMIDDLERGWTSKGTRIDTKTLAQIKKMKRLTHQKEALVKAFRAHGVNKRKAQAAINAHSQKPGGFVFYTLSDGITNDNDTVSFNLVQDLDATYNLSVNDDHKLTLECRFQAFPIKNAGETKVLGTSLGDIMGYIPGPIKASFQLVYDKEHGWGYELEKVESKHPLIIELLRGETISIDELLERHTLYAIYPKKHDPVTTDPIQHSQAYIENMLNTKLHLTSDFTWNKEDTLIHSSPTETGSTMTVTLPLLSIHTSDMVLDTNMVIPGPLTLCYKVITRENDSPIITLASVETNNPAMGQFLNSRRMELTPSLESDWHFIDDNDDEETPSLGR